MSEECLQGTKVRLQAKESDIITGNYVHDQQSVKVVGLDVSIGPSATHPLRIENQILTFQETVDLAILILRAIKLKMFVPCWLIREIWDMFEDEFFKEVQR